MEEQRIYIQRFAMHYGTYMGLYWMLIFSFFPLGLTRSFLLLLFMSGLVSIPFVGYRFARNYRDKVCGGYISYIQALAFLALMFMFAALLSAVGNYIYFAYIDKGYIFETYSRILDTVPLPEEPAMQNYMTMGREAIAQLHKASPIQLVFSLLSSGITWCFLLSLLLAALVSKRKPTN